MAMGDTDRDTVTRFVSLAASNRVAENEIAAATDTLDAVIEFCQRLQRQFASARTCAHDDGGERGGLG